MEPRTPTTPFGRRTLTLAHVATQMAVSSRRPDKVVHKWQIPKITLTEHVAGHCHAATNLRSFWSPGSQWDGEDQLRWIPVPAGDH